MEERRMLQMWWPIGVLLVSNIAYNVLAKKLPTDIDAFASLSIIYLLAAVISLVMFFVVNKNGDLIGEYKKFNWVVPLIALCIMGMEVGTFYLYRVGWPISVGMIINYGVCSVCLVLVGFLFFHETITLSHAIGIVAVIVGLLLINK